MVGRHKDKQQEDLSNDPVFTGKGFRFRKLENRSDMIQAKWEHSEDKLKTVDYWECTLDTNIT